MAVDIIFHIYIILMTIFALLELRHLQADIRVSSSATYVYFNKKFFVQTLILMLIPWINIFNLIYVNFIVRAVLFNYGMCIWNKLYPTEKITYKILKSIYGAEFTEILMEK